MDAGADYGDGGSDGSGIGGDADRNVGGDGDAYDAGGKATDWEGGVSSLTI